MKTLRNWVNQLCFCSVLLICGLAVNAAAQVNNYYVAPSGSDSNDGSQARPWHTLPKAINSFALGSGGAVIHVAAGSYASANASCTEGGVAVCVNRGGSSSTVRLKIQCDPGAASAYAAQGQCKISGGEYGILVQASNVDVVGFDVGNTAGMATGLMAVYCGTKPSASTCSNSVHFIGNYVHDLGSSNTGGCPSAGAIEFSQTHGGSLSDPQAIGNLVVRYGSDPGANSCNLTHGIYVNTGNARIQNNIIVQVPTFGITYYSSACFGTVSNNVVIRAKGGLVFGTDGIGTSCANQGSNTINNNYFANILTKGNIDNSSTDCTGSTPNFIGHNMSDGSAPNGDFVGLSSCDIVSPTSMTHVAGAAMFINYKTDGTGDYHLKAGSPGIDAGITTCSTGSGAISPCVLSADFEGVAMTVLPVGAYTFGGAASAVSAPTNLTAVVQ